MSKEPVPETIAGFYDRLFAILLPEGSIGLALPIPEVIARSLRGGIPVVQACRPLVDPDCFVTTLQKVARLVGEHYHDLAAECRRLEASLPGEAEARKALVDKVFKPGDGWVPKPSGQVAPETWLTVLRHTAGLFMRELAQMTEPYRDREQWLRGVCPVCGGKPDMALLERDKGRRYLYCGRCDVEWRFPRLECPYCGNPGSQYLVVEGEEVHKIYVCENCRGYLKTVDARRINGEPDLFWENLRTIDLDLVAQQQGFERV